MRTLVARQRQSLTVLLAFGLLAAAPCAARAQLFQRWCPLCPPCPPCPTTPSTGAAGQPATGGTSATGQPGGEAAQTPSTEAPSDLFAYSGAGAASGPESVGMNMVGDYLGGFVTMSNAGSGASQQIPLPGGAIPRFKMAEDTSPMPTDRGYFIYDYYGGVPYNGVANGNSINLSGFTPGFEKTFLGGAMSVELRLPMASTLNNTIFLAGGTGTGDGEIGNLGVSVKALLYHSDTTAISGGLAIDCPTAHNSVCVGDDGAAIQMVNQSVHLLPFVGVLWVPNDRLFAIGFAQFDIDANGDAVNNGTFDGTFESFGDASLRYYEQTMLYLDGTVGYWLRRNDSDHTLTGIAVFGELHLDQSLNTSAPLATEVGTMSGNTISILDMTAGADFQIGELTTVTTAFCTPVTAQREFNGQFRLLINRRF